MFKKKSQYDQNSRWRPWNFCNIVTAKSGSLGVPQLQQEHRAHDHTHSKHMMVKSSQQQGYLHLWQTHFTFCNCLLDQHDHSWMAQVQLRQRWWQAWTPYQVYSRNENLTFSSLACPSWCCFAFHAAHTICPSRSWCLLFCFFFLLSRPTWLP